MQSVISSKEDEEHGDDPMRLHERRALFFALIATLKTFSSDSDSWSFLGFPVETEN